MQTAPFGDVRIVDNPVSQGLFDQLAVRVGSMDSIKICDDPGDWDWRAYLAERARLTITEEHKK